MSDKKEAVTNDPAKWKVVYTIIDRGEGKRPFWLKIGAAYPNRDGSLSVKLDALPTNGTMHIRDYVPMDDYPKKEG